MRFFISLLTLLFFAVPLHAKTISGTVVHVSDGDTIRVKDRAGKEHEIRFYGIDTPETKQAFGNSAKRFTSKATYKKTVKVEVYDVDRYGRTVGVVVSGNTNVNQSLIENGLAWQYSRYCKESFCDDWKRLERLAQQQKRGLWVDNDPTPPWQWRKEQKEGNDFINFLRDMERFLKWILRVIDQVEEIINPPLACSKHRPALIASGR